MSKFGNAPSIATRRSLQYARLRVDVANTAFWEGKEFRVSREYAVGSTPFVLKFDAPVDFILQTQSLTCDTGNIKFTAYRAIQGVESGTFTPEPIYKNNFTAESGGFAPQVTVSSGGSFTPNGGEVSVETIRLRTSGATAQRTTVSGGAAGERGLAAGTYYLILSRIDGTDTAAGVYDLEWEERY